VTDGLIRAFDVILSGCAIALLAPLFAIISLVLRLTGEGEILFAQERVGKNGRMFRLLKFATMLKDSPFIGTGVLTIRNDPRILPVGRFLRKTKLNELPQLFNVLSGSMSLIGPRPQAAPHFQVFAPEVRSLLLTVKPGLSGIGSIVFRSEETVLEQSSNKEAFYANVIAPYKGDIEVWYIARISVGLYFKLLLLTIWVVLFPSSSLHWTLLKDLPKPPEKLKGLM